MPLPVPPELIDRQLDRVEKRPLLYLAISLGALAAFLGWLLYQTLNARIEDQKQLLRTSEETKAALIQANSAKDELLKFAYPVNRSPNDTFARR